MSKKEYTPKEAGINLLDRIKAKLSKSAPQNKTFAQAADLKIPQQAPAPQGNEKTIAKKPELKLKKFMDAKGAKKADVHALPATSHPVPNKPAKEIKKGSK